MANLTYLLLTYINSHEQAPYILGLLNLTAVENINDSRIFIKLLESLYFSKNESDIELEESNGIDGQLLLYIPPLLLVLGTIGNILAFIVLVKNSRKVSTYHYLYVLAVMDLLLLMTGLLHVWIKQLTGIFIQDEADWLCKLFVFVGFFSSDASVWLIIAVTVERWIAVQMPLKTSIICTPRRTKLSIIGVLTAIASVNSHFLWSMELQSTNGTETYKKKECAPSPQYAHLINNVWPWVDAIIYSFAPFVIISAVNFMIVTTVCAARRRREGLLLSSKQKKLESRRANSKLTMMLLALSFSFLFLTLPMNIMMIATVFWNKESHSPEENSTFTLIKTIAELLMYTNHTVNFMLYFVTGQRFRQQFSKIIIPCKTVWEQPRNECERTQQTAHNMKRLGSWNSDTCRKFTSHKSNVISSKNSKPTDGQYV
jgi:hypothetical protein